MGNPERKVGSSGRGGFLAEGGNPEPRSPSNCERACERDHIQGARAKRGRWRGWVAGERWPGGPASRVTPVVEGGDAEGGTGLPVSISREGTKRECEKGGREPTGGRRHRKRVGTPREWSARTATSLSGAVYLLRSSSAGTSASRSRTDSSLLQRRKRSSRSSRTRPWRARCGDCRRTAPCFSSSASRSPYCRL